MSLKSEEDDVIGRSVTVMPTPRVIQEEDFFFNNSTDSYSEEDLDLGLGYFPGLSNVDPGRLFGEVQNNEVESSAALSVSSSQPEATSPLRNDCMWDGCQLPPLSWIPNDASSILFSTSRGTQLDTIGSIRTETPLSNHDSDMDIVLNSEVQNKVTE